MTKHLTTDIDNLKALTLALSAEVEESMHLAVKALQERDAALAERVIQYDHDIDEKEVRVEEECLKILALHQPVAVDLRFVVAVLKLNNDLERIGDLSVNIAERALFLSSRDPVPVPLDFAGMVEKTQAMLRQALDAMVNLDVEVAYRVCAADDEVRAVILAAKGPVYSSGHDMREVIGVEADRAAELFTRSTKMMESIREMPKPVIAQVQALASAAGCQLVASCDLAVAASGAGFQTPGVQIGLFCSTPMVPLSRAIPPKKAMEMLLTGEAISADDALAAGLVNRVVPPERLEEETMALARRIAAFSSYTVGLGKEAFYKQLPLSFQDAYEVGIEAMVRNVVADDAQEGMTAFLEKRQPRWKH